MSRIQPLLNEYGESHQDHRNKFIHWICVPAIMFSLFGLLYAIPFPGGRDLFTNWAAVILAVTLMYYISLSVPLFLGFVLIGLLLLWGNHALYLSHGMGPVRHVVYSLIIFAVAWVGQFYGHHLEGKRPSFLKDLQFLLIGPAWLLHFIYRRLGIPY
jgi:uncharacterized membrane protein YGL010W